MKPFCVDLRISPAPGAPSAIVRATVCRSADGRWVAVCQGPTGRESVHAMVDERAIAQTIRAVVGARLGPGADTSGLWDSIKKIARKVAKGRVLAKLARGFKEVLKSPIARTLLAAGGQAIGIPAPVTLAATSLVAGALRGDKKAKKKIALVAARARAGDPRAKVVQAAIAAQGRAARAGQYATLPGGRRVPLPVGTQIHIGGSMGVARPSNGRGLGAVPRC